LSAAYTELRNKINSIEQHSHESSRKALLKGGKNLSNSPASKLLSQIFNTFLYDD